MNSKTARTKLYSSQMKSLEAFAWNHVMEDKLDFETAIVQIPSSNG